MEGQKGEKRRQAETQAKAAKPNGGIKTQAQQSGDETYTRPPATLSLSFSPLTHMIMRSEEEESTSKNSHSNFFDVYGPQVLSLSLELIHGVVVLY